ncbi:MAG: bacteriohemerythrin [Gammaproteobacteria bacterium]|nr:bacteriohemerythrin [Gammaproteobacteria bacterium]MDH5799482.1 bacteriohemerythrin [Gammaproteobacteria bacterium]
MTFMPWNDEFILEINEVDTQHHWLVDATNKLHDEISKDQPDNGVVGDILAGLVEYAMNHFIMEEEMFQRFSYPETAEHKQEHDAFNVKAMQLLDHYEQGQVVAQEALEFLKNWLRHHILEIDKAYVPHMKQQGAA